MPHGWPKRSKHTLQHCRMPSGRGGFVSWPSGEVAVRPSMQHERCTFWVMPAGCHDRPCRLHRGGSSTGRHRCLPCITARVGGSLIRSHTTHARHRATGTSLCCSRIVDPGRCGRQYYSPAARCVLIREGGHIICSMLPVAARMPPSSFSPHCLAQAAAVAAAAVWE